LRTIYRFLRAHVLQRLIPRSRLAFNPRRPVEIGPVPLGPAFYTAPRRTESARPDRISFMWNTETPMGTGDFVSITL
jgi:hypothetical protein